LPKEEFNHVYLHMLSLHELRGPDSFGGAGRLEHQFVSQTG
jgi:hypothetical protein